MKLFHGTPKENLNSIKKAGLIAGVPPDVDFEMFPERGGDHAAVSLAKTIATAIAYGDIVIEVELPDDADVTEIEAFNEVLVNGNVAAGQITRIYKASESTWIPDEDVTDGHIVVGPVRHSEYKGRKFTHVVELKEV